MEIMATATISAVKQQQQQQLVVEEDRISQLPDSILHSILSLLTLKESAITTLLSKRWAHLFPTLPHLLFDDYSFSASSLKSSSPWDHEVDIDSWLENNRIILEARTAPVKTCTITSDYLAEYKWNFDGIIKFFRDDGIEDLNLYNSNADDHYTVPSYLFSCRLLAALQLHMCDFKVPPKFSGLRRLKYLKLEECVVRDTDLERLVSCCRSLERLVIEDCYRLKNFVVKAHKLGVLDIRIHRPLVISIVKAPRLKSVFLRFNYDCPGMFLTCVEMDSDEVDEWDGGSYKYDYSGDVEFCRLVRLLKDLGNIQNLSLYLGKKYLKGLIEDGVPVPKVLPFECRLQKLKKLTLRMQYDTVYLVSMVACFLNSCPVLEELVLGHHFDDEFGYGNMGNVEVGDYWDKQMPSDFLSNRLATVTLYPVSRYSQYWIKFMKFILTSACGLKRVMIHFKRDDKTQAAFEEFHQELLLLQTAFPNIVLELKPSRRGMPEF